MTFAFSIIGKVQTARAQTDTLFWFAVPEVANSHGDRPVYVRFTSQGAASTVTVDIPANPGFTPIVTALPANGLASVDLTSFIDTLEIFPANTTLNQGLRIRSTQPITAYFEVSPSNNPDIFSLKGNNALGLNFMIPGQDIMENAHGRHVFDILATEDNTTITITPTQDLEGGRAAGVPFTITLDRGQVFSCRAAGNNEDEKLIGSTVTADKPIAITVIDDSVRGGDIYNGGCYDLLGDQLIPYEQLGTEFIVQRGFLNVHSSNSNSRTERVIIMAISDDTKIYLDGSGTPVATIDEGETYHRRMGSNLAVTHILTDKPVYVLHISGYGCETGQAIIPAIRCTGSSQVGFRRSTSEHFALMIITRATHINNFLLNGSPYNPAFSVVPGTANEWYYAKAEYSNNDTAIFNLSNGYLLSNATGNFHLGLINGGASSGCRYGYFSGFSLVTVTATSNSTVEAPACQASPVFIEADSTALATYNWTGPNGFTSTLRRIDFNQVTFADTGLYTVTATVDNCVSSIDSITILIKEKPNVASATNTGPYCDGATIQLFADTVPGVTYLWSGPAGFSSTDQHPVISAASFANGGTYQLITLLNGCSSDTTTTDVYVYPVPVIVPLGATTFCRYDSVTLRTGGGVSYTWFLDGQPVPDQTDSTLTVTLGGFYSAVVTNAFGCKDTADEVEVLVMPLPDKMIQSNPGSNICLGDSTLLSTNSGYSYAWYRDGNLLADKTDSSFFTTLPGDYQVISTSSDGCVDSSSILTVQTFALPVAQLDTSDGSRFCAGDSLLLKSVHSPGYTNSWFRNDSLVQSGTDSIYHASQAGIYRLVVSVNGCSDSTAVFEIFRDTIAEATLTAQGPQVFCTGDSVLLSASPALFYQWLRNDSVIPGAVDSVLMVYTTAQWSVITTNTFGCSDTSNTIATTANPLPIPVVAAGEPTTFCFNDSVVLSATGGISYQWLKNDTVISGAVDTFLVVYSAANWSVIATDAFGCSDTSNTISTTINPLPIPVVAAGGPTTFCFNDSVVLSATGGASYQWLRNDTVLVGANDSVLTVLTAANWSVIATDAFGCSDTSNTISTTVNPLPIPVVTAGGPTIFCFNDSVVLSATGGLSYQWLRNDTVIGGSVDTFLVVYSAANWSVIATDAFGCSDTSNIIATTVNPLPIPVVAAGGPTTFCFNDSVVLTATGGVSYQWLRNDTLLVGATDSVLTVLTAANWSVIATDAFGCSDTSNTITTTVNPLPFPVIAAGGPTTFCFNDSVVLSATGGLSYQWLRNDTVIGGSVDTFLLISTAANWSVIATDAFGCSDTSNTITTTVNPLPVPVVTAGGPTTFCFNDSVVLSVTGGVSYQWLRNDTVIGGAVDSFLMVSTAANWSVIATDAFGCSDTSNTISTTVNPLPIPVVATGGPTTFCFNDSVVLSVTGGVSYQWLRNDTVIGGATDSNLTVSTAESWSVIATDAFGCSDTSNTITTTVNPLPIPVIAASGPTTFCFNDSVVLTATEGISYQWLRNDTLLVGATDSVLTVLTAANWSVIATDAFGCSDTSNLISTTVNPLPIPVVTAGGPTTFCFNDSVVLSATGGPSYQWLRNDTVLVGATDSNLTVSTAANWSVIATDAFGCSDTSNTIATTVNPLPIPVVTAGGPTTFCFNDSVVLSATGGLSYQWLRNDTVIGGAVDTFLLVSTAANWSVIATDAFGCSDTSNTIATTVNPLPVPVIAAGGPTTFCFNDSVVLSATGGVSYQWLRNDTAIGGAVDSFLMVSTAANWSVIATDAFGCSDTSNIIATTINPLPIPVVTAGGPTTFCFNDSVVLTATGGVSYQWLRNDTVLVGANDSVLTVLTAANWSVIATDAFGCSDTSNTITTIVNPLPIPVIAAGGPTTFCFNDSVVLSATGGVSYQWLRNDTVLVGAMDSVLTVSTAASWSVIATDTFGCSDTSNTITTIANPLPIPVIAAGGPTTFCFNDSVVISATGGVSYQWLRNDTVLVGAMDSVLTVSTAASWSVMATDAFGCSDTSNTITTIVNPLPIPVVNAGGPTTFCFNDSVVLSATGGLSYQWLRNDTLLVGATDSVLTVSTAANWSVIATDAFGCSDTSNTITTTVNPLPVPVIIAGGPTTFCFNDSVVLSVTGGVSYQWLRNDTVIGGAVDSFLMVSTTANWSAIATDAFGCSDTSNTISTTVNPLPIPVVTAGGPTIFCFNDSVVLSATGGLSYQWLRNDTVLVGATDSNLTVSTAANWSVIATDAFGCSDTSNTIATTVNPLPVPIVAAGGPTTFCFNDSVVLTATGGLSYQWLRNDTLLVGATDSVLTVLTAANWSVIATDAFGCSDTSNTITTTVNPLPIPVIAAGGPTTFCFNDSMVLSATGGISYQWLRNDTVIGGAVDTFLVVYSAANWSVIATDAFGCSDTSNTISTTINPLPIPVIAAGGPTTFCFNDSVFLTAIGGISYQWLRNDTLLVGATDSVLTVLTAANWSVIATDAFGCSDTSNTITTTVNPLPVPVVAAGGPTTFCFNDSVVLTATGGFSYQWLRNDTVIVGSVDTFLVVSTAANWSVIATDTFGCSDTSNVIATTVNPLPIPVIAAGGPTTFCFNDSVVLSATGGISYQWLRNDTLLVGATDSVLTVLTAANWSVIATDAFGCSDTSNIISTTVNPLPVPIVAAGGPTTFCFNDSVVLTATGGISYQWLRNDTVIGGAVDTFLVVYSAANWSVIATDAFGCSDTSNVISTTVNPLPIPVIAAGGPTTFCFNDSVVLTATGGLSYQWLRNDTVIVGSVDTFLVISTAANWSVIATDAFGCSDTSNTISTTVNPLPIPVVTAGGPTIFCFNDSVVLSATGGISYQWLKNDSVIGGSVDTFLVVSTAANWSMIATDAFGCSDTSNTISTIVNPLPIPVIAAGGPTTFCFNDSVVLSATGGVSYQWLRNDTVLVGAMDSVLTVFTAANWSVIATDAFGCSDTSNTIATTVNPLPIPVIAAGGPTTFCFNDSVVLSATGGLSYQWLRNDTLLVGATDSVLTVSTAANWSVIATDAFGCSDTSNTIPTTINPLPIPVIAAGGSTTFCFNDSVVLSAIGGASYQWLRNDTLLVGATDSNFTISTAANWSVIATDAFGCSDTSNTITTTVNPLPIPVIAAGGPTTFCFNDSVVLSATGGISYQWLRNDTVLVGATDSNLTISTAANWSVIATDAFGCSDTSNTISTTVNPLPIPVVTAGGPTTFCFNDSVVLSATGGISYQWLRNDTLLVGAMDSVLTVLTAANWSVIATDAFGCSDTSNTISTTVNPLPIPVIAAGGPTTFCFNDSVVLSATGGISYQWLRNDTLLVGATDSVLTVSIAANWSVIATDTFGCSDTSNTIITTVNPLPVPIVTAGGPTTFCFNDSVVLSATGGISYQWLRNDTMLVGATDSVLTVSTTANWSVIATDAFGCSDTSNTISTTVNPLPIPVIVAGGPITFCFNDSVVLSATDGVSYQWLRNDTLLVGATDSVLTVLTAANWSVIATDAFGCSDTSNTITTTVNPLPIPIVTAGGPTTFCFNDSVVLSATGGISYQWLRNDTVLVGANDSVLTVLTAANWSVIATDAFGCSDTSNTIITTVNPLPIPVVAAGGPTTFCFNDSVVISATGGLSYQWLRNDTVLVGATDSNLTVSTAANWSVIATDAFGCSDTSNTIATIVNSLPVPVIAAGGPTTFCFNDSVVLSATGGVSYQWLRNDTVLVGATDSVLTVLTAANWSVIATNAFDCSDTSNIIITTVNPLPVPIVAAGGPTTFCFNDSVVLSATGGISYQWLRNDTVLVGANDSVLTVLTAANWSVVATDAFGCSDTSNIISTTVNPLPIPVIAAGGPTTFCFNDSVVLSATGGISYQWLRNDTLLVGATDSVLTVSTAANWSVIATDAVGCSDTSNTIATTVNPLPIPIVTAGGPTTFCFNDSVVLSAAGGISYQWLRNDTVLVGATDSVLTVSTAANWSVIATDAFGCSDTSNVISTTVNPLPTPVVTAGGPTTFCFNDSVVLTATGGASYQWLRNDIVLVGANDSVLTVLTAANWSVIATDAFGCSDTSLSMATWVNDLPLPTIAAGSSRSFCPGDSVVLTAGGAVNYQWLVNGSLVPGAQSNTLTVFSSGNWQVIGWNNAGCYDTSAVLQTTRLNATQPQIQMLTSTTFCPGDTVRMQTRGGINYQWYLDGAAVPGANDSLLVTSSPGIWTVIVYYANGCSNISQQVSIQVLNASSNYRILANNLTVCAGDSTILEINQVTNTTYQWKRDGVDIPGATDTQLVVLVSGYYSCVVTYNQNCQREVNGALVRVNPIPPSPIAQFNGPLCMNQPLQLFSSEVPGASYLWRGPNGFVSTQPNPELGSGNTSHIGWYRLRINVAGCNSYEDSVFIGLQPELQKIEINGRRTYCPGEQLKLRPDSIPEASYRWVLPNGDTLNTRQLDMQTNELTDGDFYQLLVSRGSCTDTYTEVIRVLALELMFPTAFTPNGDGLNEVFYPKGMYQGTYELEVYDRWGRKVFQSARPEDGWDGTVYGNPAETGAYTYVYRYQDCGNRDAVGKGSLQLIR